MSGENLLQYFYGKEFLQERVLGRPVTEATLDLVNKMQDITMSKLVLLLGSRIVKHGLLKSHKEFNQLQRALESAYLNKISSVKKTAKTEYNILRLLLDIQRKGDGPNDDEISGEFASLFLMNVSTNPQLISLATYWASKFPQALEKIQEEAKRELSDLNSIDQDALNRMEYTHAFLKEVIRLTGPVGMLFPRVAEIDHYIEGVKVKKGTLINVCLPVVHTRPRWYTNPDDFIPDRFYKDKVFPEDHWRKEPLAFMGFSGGPRNCLGQYYAMSEAKMILGLLLLNYEVNYPKEYKLRLDHRLFYEVVDPLEPELVKRVF